MPVRDIDSKITKSHPSWGKDPALTSPERKLGHLSGC